MIEMIALVMDNSIMSVNGQIPLILEAHLENFRQHIKGKVVVMGTHTYESLGESPFVSAKETIIMTRHKRYGKKVRTRNTLVSLLDDYKDFIVIGGRTFFADIMPIIDILYITEVSSAAEDGENLKYFPPFTQLKMLNPQAEFKHEGDTYYRFLKYGR